MQLQPNNVAPKAIKHCGSNFSMNRCQQPMFSQRKSAFFRILVKYSLGVRTRRVYGNREQHEHNVPAVAPVEEIGSRDALSGLLHCAPWIARFQSAAEGMEA